MKILLLDIETAPNTAYIWRLFKENIGISQIIESSYVMCWAAKWLGKREIMFGSVQNTRPKKMLEGIHKLLDEADVVIHYYGTSFDIPTLNKEFILYGLKPPAPYKEIDLKNTVKKRFRFTSNKLDYVCQALGLGKKKETTFELWVECMHNEPHAWKLMEKYNKHDVRLLEKLYAKIKPWIRNHANYSIYTNKGVVCPNCGSKKHQHRGWYYTQTSKYRRYQCNSCGNWFRSGKSLAPRPDQKSVNV